MGYNSECKETSFEIVHPKETHSTTLNPIDIAKHKAYNYRTSITCSVPFMNCTQLSKMSVPDTNDELLRQQLVTNTPPPSLPPLSETLSNLFPGSPKSSSSILTSPTSAEAPLATPILGTSSSQPLGIDTHNASGSFDHQQLPPIVSRDSLPSISNGTSSYLSHTEQPTQAPMSRNPQASPRSQSYPYATPISHLNEHQHPVVHRARSHNSAIPWEGNYRAEAYYTYHQGNDDSQKEFSFVSLPGVNGKKRPRRRFDEIERLYACSWPGCSKSYGTLNHLNAHVTMQKHGAKRHPSEFKELRKYWKQQKQDMDNTK